MKELNILIEKFINLNSIMKLDLDSNELIKIFTSTKSKENKKIILRLISDCFKNYKAHDENTKLILLNFCIFLARILWNHVMGWINERIATNIAQNLGWNAFVENEYSFRREFYFFLHYDKFLKRLKYFHSLKNLRILEIGSMEGMSACWFLDHIIKDESDHIICIDPKPNRRFRKNIDKNVKNQSVTLLEEKSCDAFLFLDDNELFGIVYIDGLHMAWAVFVDIVGAWCLTKENGIIIIDDCFSTSKGEETGCFTGC